MGLHNKFQESTICQDQILFNLHRLEKVHTILSFQNTGNPSCTASKWQNGIDYILFFFFFEIESGYVVQDGFEFTILLEPPNCWDYRCGSCRFILCFLYKPCSPLLQPEIQQEIIRNVHSLYIVLIYSDTAFVLAPKQTYDQVLQAAS